LKEMKAADKDLSKLGASVEKLDEQIKLLCWKNCKISNLLNDNKKEIQNQSYPKRKKALQN